MLSLGCLLKLQLRFIFISILTFFALTNGSVVRATPKIRSSFYSFQNRSPEPQPTGTGTPPPSAPAGPRPITSCLDIEQTVVPLVYGRGTDFTQLEQPSLFFYLPHELEEIGAVEVLIRDDVLRPLARYEVGSIEQSGIIKITIPYFLEADKNYQIIFKIYCGEKTPDRSNPDETSIVWIQRRSESAIEISPDLEPFETYQLYRKNQIWYDAIATLADLYFTQPKNIEIRAAWVELLESLAVPENLPESLSNLQWLVREPLVNSELHPLPFNPVESP